MVDVAWSKERRVSLLWNPTRPAESEWSVQRSFTLDILHKQTQSTLAPTSTYSKQHKEDKICLECSNIHSGVETPAATVRPAENACIIALRQFACTAPMPNASLVRWSRTVDFKGLRRLPLPFDLRSPIKTNSATLCN